MFNDTGQRQKTAELDANSHLCTTQASSFKRAEAPLIINIQYT